MYCVLRLRLIILDYSGLRLFTVAYDRFRWIKLDLVEIRVDNVRLIEAYGGLHRIKCGLHRIKGTF